MKLKYIVFSILTLFFCTNSIFAKEVEVNIKVDKTEIIVGDKINVTVEFNSDTPMYEWEYTLDYDKIKLEYVNSNYNLHVKETSSKGKFTAKYTYKFTTINSGKSYFKISKINVLDDSFDVISSKNNNLNFNIISKEQKYESMSSNNNLKSLIIKDYEIDFDKNVLEYGIEIEKNTKYIDVVAVLEDEKATIDNNGRILIKNKDQIKINVTAENGDKKEYIINLNIKGEEPKEVTINDKKYIVVMDRETVKMSNIYVPTTVKINDEILNAYRNKKTGHIILNIKEETGVIKKYIYQNQKIKVYELISYDEIELYLIKFPSNKIPNKYLKTELIFFDEIYVGYKKTYESNDVLIFGVDINTGEENIYIYNKKLETLETYNQDIKKNKKTNIFKIIIPLILGLTCLISTILIILKRIKYNKRIKGENIIN